MIPVLTVEFETAPLERTGADVIVVAVAPLDRPLRGAAGYADWRLRGQLWKLVSTGRISGTRGEVSLVIPGPGLDTRLLLVLGLGPRRLLDGSTWQEVGRSAIDRAMGLRARRVTLAVLQDGYLDRPLADPERSDAAAGLIAGAARAVLARNADLQLTLLGALPVTLEAGSIPAGVEVRVSGSPIPEKKRPSPTGGSDSVPRGVQGISPARRFL